MNLGFRIKGLGVWIIALQIFSAVLAQGEEKYLPDAGSLLPTLQKVAGNKWIVAKVSEGYLLTYAAPVVICRGPLESSKHDASWLLSNGRRESFRLRIIFGAVRNSHEVLHSITDVGNPTEVPPNVSCDNKLTPTGYFVSDPPVWAIGHRYSVYFVVNVGPNESLLPREAEMECGDALETFGEVFGCHPDWVIED